MPNRPYSEIEGHFETALKGEVVSYEGIDIEGLKSGLAWKNSPVHVHDDNALRRLPQAGYFAARALNDRSFH
jgi:hypothetical protein